MIPLHANGTQTFVEIELDEAVALIKAIASTLKLGEENGFEWEAMVSLLRYYSTKCGGRVLILAEEGRRLHKERSGDRSGLSILGTAEMRNLVREPTRNAPAIVLLKQVGGRNLGWNAGPFWWPMLASPPQATPCVYANKIAS